MSLALAVSSEAPDGTSYDLTPRAEGLQFSSVNPGGDERAGFTYRRPWSKAQPELARGNLLRITYGVDVLWMGRISERDRQGGSSEEVAVTALGLGASLKRGTMTEIYVDRSADSWEGPTLNVRITLADSGNIVDQDFTASVDQQSIRFDGTANRTSPVTDAIPQNSQALLMYRAPPGCAAAVFEYEGRQAGVVALEAQTLRAIDDDTAALSSWDAYTLTLGTAPSYGGLQTQEFTTPQTFLMLRARRSAAAGGQTNRPEVTYRYFAVYGDHALERQENDGEPDGFYVSQLVADVIARAANGPAVRTINPSNGVVIDHLVFDQPTTHEEALQAIDAFEIADWGTWGPTSPLDHSKGGYFDYLARDRITQHWVASRPECDEVAISDEDGSLYDTVVVNYTDETGTPQMATLTTTIPDLAQSQSLVVDGGQLTDSLAGRLAQVILDAQGTTAPARGQVTISRPITHYRRGKLPPCYLRADGSNLRVPDVLPLSNLVSLATDTDRRTTFPIKRVTIDAGGEVMRASVEVDQTFDALSLLQTRLGLARDLAPAVGRHGPRRNRRGRGRR